MRPRVWIAILAAAGLCALSAAACNAVNGLNDFEKIDCVGACNDAAAFPDVVQDHKEAGKDAFDAGSEEAAPDASQPDVVEHDAPETVKRRWAQWRMPNFPTDADAGLPNPASYQAAAPDAGVVLDNVTAMRWERNPDTQPRTYDEAVQYCKDLKLEGFTWEVPTRIELVSLLDPTSSPCIDKQAFASGDGDEYWTSSPVARVSDAQQWTVNFSTALVQGAKTSSTRRVRCVHP